MSLAEPDNPQEVCHLARLISSCDRKGYALMLALSRDFEVSDGFGERMDRAFETAAYLSALIAKHAKLELVTVFTGKLLSQEQERLNFGGTDQQATTNRSEELVATRLRD